MHNRIQSLDGLRGLAILLVIGFHAYSRWSGIMPYGDSLDITPFKIGWLGVQLFFLVSGFVILLTLENSLGPKDFAIRRWLRLFPAMLIASLLIYSTADYFSERPAGAPSTLLSLLPGLSFIAPDWWQYVLNTEIRSLEGSFWSLYVECKFYVFAACVYFTLGRKALVWALFLSFVSAYGLRSATFITDNSMITTLDSVATRLSLEHFGWFAAGAAFYIYHKDQDRYWLNLSLIIGVVSVLFSSAYGYGVSEQLAAGGLTALFALALTHASTKKLLSSRPLLFFGYISYPLYLIHENIMVASVIKLGRADLIEQTYLLPLLPIAGLSALAYLIAKYLEPGLKHYLSNRLNNLAKQKRLDVQQTGGHLVTGQHSTKF